MATLAPNRPRIGIPWRTSADGPGDPKNRYYAAAVEKAGGEPIELALDDSQRLEGLLPTLHGFVLPGSPADVEPRGYGRQNQGKSAPADLLREQTDRAILQHAFEGKKP